VSDAEGYLILQQDFNDVDKLISYLTKKLN
jgi:hypothetical protein